MSKHYQIFRKSAKFLGAICGALLISVPALPITAVAQQKPDSKVNPCPKIFYEEPHNSRVFVPQGCPPNAITRSRAAQGSIPVGNVRVNTTEAPSNPDANNSQTYSSQSQSTVIRSGDGTSSSSSESQTYQSSRTTQPSPEQLQAPSARIVPTNGRVSVMLVNDTAARITYQALGDTAPRTLPGKSEVMLQGLRTPTTVTFQRQDNGLLMVNTQPSSQSGVLEVRLAETTDFKMDRRAMRIQENGSVFLN